MSNEKQIRICINMLALHSLTDYYVCTRRQNGLQNEGCSSKEGSPANYMHHHMAFVDTSSCIEKVEVQRVEEFCKVRICRSDSGFTKGTSVG